MVILHLGIFLLSGVAMWFATTLIIAGVEGFSKKIHVSAFVTSALILGVLTSFSEISVGINSLLVGQPQIYVGNLIGGSFVILLGIIPMLAIFHRGITLKGHLDKKQLVYFLILLAAPSFCILDGSVTRFDAVFLVVLYTVFIYTFQNHEHVWRDVRIRALHPREVVNHLLKIILGTALVYVASRFLVDQTIYFAELMRIPAFMISLIVLSIGTNMPEIVVAANSIIRKHADVAFGDYVGSATFNVILLSILTLIYGPFTLEAAGFDITFFVIVSGYILFFFFGRSKATISVHEGIALLFAYLLFLFFEISEIFLFSPQL